MLGCHIPSHHIFKAINIENSEVKHLHKSEQDLPYSYACRSCFINKASYLHTHASDLDLSRAPSEGQDFVHIRKGLPSENLESLKL